MIFPVVAADPAGNVYAAWVLNDPTRDGRHDLYFVASRDRGMTWDEPTIMTDRPGTRAFPWMVAGDAGRVGLVWYETPTTLRQDPADPQCGWAGEGLEAAEWHLHYAFSADAAQPGPHFGEVLADPQPVHRGPLDRPFAELMQVEFDPQGRAAVAYVADRPEGDARPMFVLQASGPGGRAGS